MYPKIVQIGPFTIYSFGLMLATAFIVASYLLALELKRKKMDPNLANGVTLIALISGVAGSKVLYLLEHWSLVVKDPIGMAFSPGGLTIYGGFFLAAFGIYLYCRSKKISFMRIADAVSPGLILAYGIGRIGCHLAGDGDYGFPTTLPWGTDYSNGTYPPSVAFRDISEVASRYPGGIVPDTTLCHPTPIYEFLLAGIAFLVLWRLRTRWSQDGKLFSLYLLLAGGERFLVEFLRINPRVAFGLTEAQYFSLALVLGGLILWYSGTRSSPQGKS